MRTLVYHEGVPGHHFQIATQQETESLPRYRRDGIARSLRRAKTSTIGVIISDITNPFFADLVRGIEDRIYGREDGYNIILCNTDEHGERERYCLDMLQEKRIEGLIIVPAGGNEDYLGDLVADGLPLVFADRYLGGVEADAVLVDNRDGARRLTEHLLGFGHRRVCLGLVQQGLVTVAGRATTDPFEDIEAEDGLPFTVRILLENALRHAGGAAAQAARHGGTGAAGDRTAGRTAGAQA